jgi:uncharacterized protein (TIGR02646 family)
MIAIKPYFDVEPPELWAAASQKRYKSKHNPNGQSKLELALQQGGDHDFDREIYGSKVVKSQLRKIFKHKCAFCESKIGRGAHFDVEHFRSKSQYYWLGYEWSNLLLSCQICNRDYKKTQFPLRAEKNRIHSPPRHESGDLDRSACSIRQINEIEEPLLIHPALNEPNIHLKFLSNGSIVSKTIEGETSIPIYGLNRDSLIDARKEIVQEIRQEIWEEYEDKNELSDDELITEVRKAINRLKRRIQKNEEYISFTQTILDNFNEFIIDNEDLGIIMPDKDRLQVIAQMLLER